CRGAVWPILFGAQGPRRLEAEESMVPLLLQTLTILADAPLVLPRDYPSLRHLTEEVREKKQDLEVKRHAFTKEAPEKLTQPYATYHLAQAEASLAEAQARLAEARGERQQASVQWRKVVAHTRDTLELIKKHRMPCSPAEWDEAVGHLAEVR